jgi:uncharacterized OsmC-like protein
MLDQQMNARDLRIQSAQARAITFMQGDPTRARSKTTTTGVVGQGLACTITQGDYTYVADLGRGMGGDAAGPSPSFFARAGIAVCVAMAIKMCAANQGYDFARVTVDVETDMSDLALWGIGEHSAAPIATKIDIAVVAELDDGTVAAIVETALARDPWYLALRDRQVVTTAVKQLPTAA